MVNYLERLEYLVGKDIVKGLKKKEVLICGCGGVGSFVAEALARSGVGKITLLDFDVIEKSNLNRQLMSNKENIGKPKTYALKERLENISNAKVSTINEFINSDFELNKNYDYVVDCIDTLTSKFVLVKKCHEKNIPVISSLGTAKRIEIKNIIHTTLDKTKNDPLAKAFRNLVKKEKYKHKIDVVFIDTTPLEMHIEKKGKTNKEKYPLGSSIFTVGSAGLYIAEIVFENLIKKH